MGQGLLGHKSFILVNQYAGGGKAKGWWQSMLPQLEQQGLDFFWQYSQGGLSSARQVREAVLQQGATAVLTIGGDGSLHDCVNGLIENDRLIRPGLVFGIYPAGSACDFARMIYDRRGDNSFIDLLLSGKTEAIDIGRCDFELADGSPAHAYFLNGSDLGLGAETCLRVNTGGGLLKRLSGPLAFFVAVVQALFSYRYGPVEVEADGVHYAGEYLIAGAGNGRYMGGNMRLFPLAELNDGKLDLLLVGKMRKPTVLRMLIRAYAGKILTIKQVQYCQAGKIRLAPAQRMQLELDGELPGFTPATMQALPGILPLLVFDKA